LLQITLCKWILPYLKERWQVSSSSRLSKFEQMDDPQQIPLAINFGTYLLSRPTTVLRQAVGNDLIFEVEVIDPEDEQRDI